MRCMFAYLSQRVARNIHVTLSHKEIKREQGTEKKCLPADTLLNHYRSSSESFMNAAIAPVSYALCEIGQRKVTVSSPPKRPMAKSLLFVSPPPM